MEKQTTESVFLQWIAPAYRYTEKTLGWYLVMGTIILIFVLWGILSESYIVSATFLILAAVYYFMQREAPPMLKVQISDIGIRFGKQFYRFSDIKAFWIYYDPPELHVLNLQLNKKLDSQISIDFPPELPVAKLRDYLLSQLSELQNREESFSEALIRHLGL